MVAFGRYFNTLFSEAPSLIWGVHTVGRKGSGPVLLELMGVLLWKYITHIQTQQMLLQQHNSKFLYTVYLYTGWNVLAHGYGSIQEWYGSNISCSSIWHTMECNVNVIQFLNTWNTGINNVTDSWVIITGNT